MSDHMLSTKDNPYNPFTQWDEWYAWDTQEGYHSLSLLGRMVRTSDELSPELQEQAYDDAVDQIVSDNFSGVHIKVANPTVDKT
jgi:hypothetical protein